MLLFVVLQAIFQRYPRPEKEYQSFSLVYSNRSLDLVGISLVLLWGMVLFLVNYLLISVLHVHLTDFPFKYC